MDIDYNLKEGIKKIVGYEINSITLEKDDIIELLEELVGKYQILKKEFEDYKQDVEDNYRPIPIAEQVGISDRDFI